MATSNVSRGLTLDTDCPNASFIRDFALDGLWKALTDFGCGNFESLGFIEWYWRTSQNWPALGSQDTFNKYARERLSDKVGYTRRQFDAWNTIDRFFDKGSDLTLNDVLDAVTFCSPTQAMPFDVDHAHPKVLVDITGQKRYDESLKIDPDFLPVLVRLYPWELVESRVKVNKRPWKRIDLDIIKSVPVGSGMRKFNLSIFAFWWKYKNARRDEMAEAIAFHSADRLDWSSGNLYSRWREGLLAERYKNRVDPVLDLDAKIPTIDARFPRKLKEGEVEPLRPATLVLKTPASRDVYVKTPESSIVGPMPVVDTEDGPREIEFAAPDPED
jgi:hypothetical protein